MAIRQTAVLALGVVTLLGAACQSSGVPAARATDSESSTPAPVVYVQQSQGWELIDWTGKAHGLIGSDRVGNPYQSPDGSRVLWQPESDWQVVDRNGSVLSHIDLTQSRSIAWADDSSGLCVVRQVTDDQAPGAGAYVLDFVSATSGQSRRIASFTIGMGPDIAACSPSSGRVVITSARGFKDPKTLQMVVAFGDLRVLDLRTGAVAFTETLAVGKPSSEVSRIAVSHDGAFAALETATETSIVDLAGGRVVRTLGAVAPSSFSWDDARLAVDAGPTESTGQVIDIATGHVVWIDSVAGRVTQGAMGEPGANDLMLFVTSGQLDDLLVISPNGADHTIATNVFTAQVGPCPDCSAF
jgi:hypothetical protein